MRILIYIYIVAAAITSFWSLSVETYPALFFIELFAPRPGDKYSVAITWMVTTLAFLLPMVILLLILKGMRNRKSSETGYLIDNDYFNKSGIHFMRQKQIQSLLIASPVFINGEQRIRIDSGKTAFIELEPGTYEVEAGAKGERSDKLIVQVQANQHTQVKISIAQNGFRLNHVIEVLS